MRLQSLAGTNYQPTFLQQDSYARQKIGNFKNRKINEYDSLKPVCNKAVNITGQALQKSPVRTVKVLGLGIQIVSSVYNPAVGQMVKNAWSKQ